MQLTVEERDRGTDASGRMQRYTPSSFSAAMHGHSRNASVMPLQVTGGDSGGASVAGAEHEGGDSGVGGGSAFASQIANDPEAWGLASLTTVATSVSPFREHAQTLDACASSSNLASQALAM